MMLEYKPRATNRANALSRWPNYEVEGVRYQYVLGPEHPDLTVYIATWHTRRLPNMSTPQDRPHATIPHCRERSSRHLEFQLSHEQVLVNLP